MTLKELIYDIRILLRQLTDDSSVIDSHLIYKLNVYRALFIHDMNVTFKRLDNEWFQRLPLVSCSEVFSSDDPDVPYSSLSYGKFTLPRMIELQEATSMRLRSSSMTTDIYYKSFSELNEMIKAKDYRMKIFTYFSRINNDFYVYPYKTKISAEVILFNPLDGYEFQTEFWDLSNLTHGSNYTVISGSVQPVIVTPPAPLAVVIKKGQTFTANSNYTYTGNGKVKLLDQITAVTGDYEYPVGGDIAQRMVIEILTKDFQIERSQVFDVINDSIDQLKLVYSKVGRFG